MKWYDWPAKRSNNLAPAYTIAWRTIWFPPFYVLRCLICGVIAVGWGPRAAQALWYRIS